MNAAAILAMIAEALPLLSALTRIIDREQKSDVPEVLAVIGAMTPIAQRLVGKIEAIRTQTEADHPAVWAAVRDDWNRAAGPWLKP